MDILEKGILIHLFIDGRGTNPLTGRIAATSLRLTLLSLSALGSTVAVTLPTPGQGGRTPTITLGVGPPSLMNWDVRGPRATRSGPETEHTLRMSYCRLDMPGALDGSAVRARSGGILC